MLFLKCSNANSHTDQTASGLGPLSTLKQNQTAANTYQNQVADLTTLVQGTVTKVTSLQQTVGGLTSRAEDATAIAGVLSNVLLEVNGALNNVDGTLGLGKFTKCRTRKPCTNRRLQALSSTSPPLSPALCPVSSTVSSPSSAVS